MRRTLFTLALAALVALPALAQDKQDKGDNPLKKAKAGDWASYKLSTSVMGNDISGQVKQTVTDVTDKTATIKAETRINDMDLPAQEQKIDLTEPLDPLKMMQRRGQGGDMKKVDDGTEKVKVGDKTYDCTWTRYTAKQKLLGDQELEMKLKLWTAKDAPLSGIVKMEMKSDFADVAMELSDSGKGK